MNVRPPAVAGLFYPAERAELASEVTRLLAEAKPGRAPKAVIAPHAGYIYSGPIAASAFRLVPKVERVVLLGPSHFVWLDSVALPEADRYATPLGELPIEAPPGVPRSRAVHQREHSLEVEVPFLQVALAKEFTLVPIAVGDPEFAALLLDRLWGGPETLVVISSDLSHYLPYAAAKRIDAETAARIVALEEVPDGSACGSAPVNALLKVARKRRLRAELLDLRNSGDTAGDRSRVVGYGAFAFHEEAKA